ncbi:MAG: amino acid ABC transporter substrate-binding protein [Halanaeroarchaeum sp.]
MTRRDVASPAEDDSSESARPLDRRSLLACLATLSGGCAGTSDTTVTDVPTRTLARTGTSTPTPTTASEGPIVVAGTLPLSGSLSAIGVPLREGLFSWSTYVNRNGGLRGRTVDLRIEDDRGKPSVAREAYRSFVDGADLLIAPYGSRATKAIIDVVESAGLPCVAHTAGERSIWAGGREWTVQLLNPIDTFLHSLLAVVARRGAESVALLYRDDSFTPTMMNGAVERARELGWRITAEVTYTSTDDIVSKMEAVTDSTPDLLIGGGFQPGAAGGGFLPDAVALSRAYQQADGSAGLVNWAIGASFPAFRRRRGAVAGLEAGVTGWKPYVDFPGNAGFIDRYREQVGEPPDAHAAQGYATGQVLAAAVDRAGSFDPGAVRDALFALRTATVFGRYRVDERGLEVGKHNAVVQWQDGDPTVVGPERWREGKLVYS